MYRPHDPVDIIKVLISVFLAKSLKITEKNHLFYNRVFAKKT